MLFSHTEPVTSIRTILTPTSSKKIGRHKGSSYEFHAVAQKRCNSLTNYSRVLTTSFFSPEVKINKRFRRHFPIRRLLKEQLLHQSNTFFCPVRHSYFQGCTSCVANRGQDLYGLLEHNSEGAGCSITAKSSVVLAQRLVLLIINYLGKSRNIVASWHEKGSDCMHVRRLQANTCLPHPA